MILNYFPAIFSFGGLQGKFRSYFTYFYNDIGMGNLDSNLEVILNSLSLLQR